jgi:hypothetical protein
MWIATPSSQRTCTAYSLPVSRRTPIDFIEFCTVESIVPGCDRVAKVVKTTPNPLISNDSHRRLVAPPQQPQVLDIQQNHSEKPFHSGNEGRQK